MLRQLLNSAIDFCYPGVCASCEEPIEGAGYLCKDCANDLDDLASAPACPHCAKPAASAAGPCAYCFGNGIAPFDRIIRLGIYDHPLDHLIHQMKYHNRWSLGEQLADRLIETERAKGLPTLTDAIVPVPLHYLRQIKRGYNQAEVIARRIGKQCRIPVVHAARRTRATETQTHLHSHDKRLANVRNAFTLKPAGKKLFGRHVVVIDDVMTSGATLKAVAYILKEAAPASLCALVLAIADPKHRGFEAI